MSKLKTNLSDTFIGKIWKFLWVLLEEEGEESSKIHKHLSMVSNMKREKIILIF